MLLQRLFYLISHETTPLVARFLKISIIVNLSSDWDTSYKIPRLHLEIFHKSGHVFHNQCEDS